MKTEKLSMFGSTTIHSNFYDSDIFLLQAHTHKWKDKA